MATIPLLSVFFGGLTLLFLTGRLIGHILGLDKYFSNDKSPLSPDSYKKEPKKKRKVKTKKGNPANGLNSSVVNLTNSGQDYSGSYQIN